MGEFVTQLSDRDLLVLWHMSNVAPMDFDNVYFNGKCSDYVKPPYYNKTQLQMYHVLDAERVARGIDYKTATKEVTKLMTVQEEL